MINSTRFFFVLVVFSLVSGCTQAPNQTPVQKYVTDYIEFRPTEGFGKDISLDEAETIKREVIRELEKNLGPSIGYKAGFTALPVQEKFGLSAPAWGAMFDVWMVKSGAEVSPESGNYPSYEADFLVVVGEPGLADATTPLEALNYISYVVPFIELPDGLLMGDPNGMQVIAANITFRGGVLGDWIPVETSEAFVETLGTMSVVMTDGNSTELGRTTGQALMGNPMEAAIWLARALRADGIELKAGDLLSLGGFFPPKRAASGLGITVQYIGLPGNPAATVSFK